MPEEKTIHDLPIAEQTNASDVFETEIPSSLMQSGYASRKVTMSSLETHMLGTEQYETQLPNFPQGSRSVFSALEYARQSGGGGGASVVQKTMAEYTALPTSEKMNGSIYKITDKALIYCLDEEYHALKEITSADYAQLTSDEKNNGTLYVLTDEETTAADIPYSAGVSVADKLDTIPTSVTTGSITPRTNITILRSSLYRLGDIKFMSVIFQATGTATKVGDLPTGFEPKYNVDLSCVSDNNNPLRIRIVENSTTIDISTSLSLNTYYAFSVAYI